MMPWFAALFLGLFNTIAGFVGVYVTKKLAFGIAAVSVFGVLTFALYAGLTALIQGIYYSLPNWPGIDIAMYMAVPANLPAAVSACIGCDVAVALYRWNVQNLKILSYIT